VPANVGALILSVTSSPQNSPGGHLYYKFEAYQQNNLDSGKLVVDEQRFDGHGNIFYAEYLLPWDGSGNPVLEIGFLFSVCNGTNGNYGNMNKLHLRVEGWIEA
jgi:hypothetical protein